MRKPPKPLTNERLKELIDKHPPMTEEQKDEQAISFAYGNVRLAGTKITKEQVREIYKKMKKKNDL